MKVANSLHFFPSPRPSPSGRGRIESSLAAIGTAGFAGRMLENLKSFACFPLSRGSGRGWLSAAKPGEGCGERQSFAERVRVRANRTYAFVTFTKFLSA